MVLSAFQQAGAHQQFQQFHAGIIQNSMAMGMMGPGGATELAGGLMSQGMAAGGPGLMGAAGMLGLDPMSLGLRAGMGAWKMGGGLLSAGMAGAGAMAVGGLAIGAGALVGGQMMSGAQQQIQLNRGLSSNFNFVNNQGGMGFTQSQGFQIGAGLREMAGQFGPAGEVTSFGELSRLAQNMGRMGMAQNVRTVKEFREKFSTMLKTLKTVATELGTSLEEAQKTIASMRSVGVFKPGSQVEMAKAMRAGAAAGGLAMSEVSGMAQIGSQIARSVGGLGRAGAFGGARTISQVGTALQTGVLSEEDIYNATGLTGAEGRQAFATNMMQQSAQFLRGGRGRRFLASIAGEGGTLNEQSVAEWMTGGVGTGRTMEMAYKNLGKIGRADFIRNEGRLRGAALEQFGGLLQPMVYKQWLQQRGYDPNQMDDRSMLAFQRFSGLGRDEAEAALKMTENLPQLMRQQTLARQDLNYADRLRRERKTSGIEGVKTSLKQAREHIQGRLQQAGSDLMESLSMHIGEAFTQMIGAYERTANEDINTFSNAIREGRGGQMQGFNVMTRGSGALAGPALTAGGARVPGARPGEGIAAVNYRKDLEGFIASGERATRGTSEAVDKFMANQSSFEAYRSFMQAQGTRAQGTDRIDSVRRFLNQRARSGNKEDIALATLFRNSSREDQVALISRIEQRGGIPEEEGMVAGLRRELEQANRPRGGEGPATEAMRLAEQGRAVLGREQFTGLGLAAGSAAAGLLAIPGAIMGLAEAGTNLVMGEGFKASATFGMWKGGADAVAGWVTGLQRGASDTRAGQLLQQRGMQERIAGLYSGRGAEFAGAQRRLMQLEGQRARGEYEEGSERDIERQMLRKAQAAGIASRFMRERGVTDPAKLTQAQRDEIVSRAREATNNNELTWDQIAQGDAAMRGALDQYSLEMTKEVAQRVQSGVVEERKRIESMGIAEYRTTREQRYTATTREGEQTMGRLRAAAQNAGMSVEQYVNSGKADREFGGRAGLSRAGISMTGTDVTSNQLTVTAATRQRIQETFRGDRAGADAATRAIELGLEAANMDVTTGDQGKSLERFNDLNRRRVEAMDSLSIEQKRRLARVAAGTETGEMAAVAMAQQERLVSLTRAQGRRGLRGGAAQMAGLAGMLGVELDKDVAQRLATAKPEGAAAQFVAGMGLSDDERRKFLESGAGTQFRETVQRAVTARREGREGEAARLMSEARGNLPEDIAKKMDEAQDRRAARAGDPQAKIVTELRNVITAIYALGSKLPNNPEGGDNPPQPGAPTGG